MKIESRTTHSCIQGSAEWHALRASRFTASEAPAMMGVHKTVSRTDLLRMKKTGVAPDVSAWVQRFLFDKGHAAEAEARPIVEGIIGEELFPVTMTADVEGLSLLASMDGITMLGDIGWETKLLNQELRAAVEAGELPEHYTAQMEQQLMVSGAERIYFTTSDGTPEGTFGMWYESDPALRARIVAGWKQFAEDLAEYVPEPETAKPVGAAPDALPALRIEVTGMVTASNLAQFREHAMAVFGGINTDLQTDQDFADAEKTVKWCKEVEDRLDAAKQHALSQTASIDELFRTIDAIKAEARAKRLELDKLVKSEKEARKLQIVTQAHQALVAHVQQLNQRIAPASIPSALYGQQMFGDAIKGLKSLDSMRDKIGTALANAKIETNALADRIEANRKTIEDMSLMPDFAAVCTKAPDDFAALLALRRQQRAEAEAKRLEAERERIRQEEEAKARREAERLAQAERDRIRAEEQAKAQREAQEAAQQRQQQAEQQRALDQAEDAAIVATPAPATDNGNTVTLGQINQRLAPITLTAAGIASLGIDPVGRERAAVLYRERDIGAICAALIRHLSAVSTPAVLEGVQ